MQAFEELMSQEYQVTREEGGQGHWIIPCLCLRRCSKQRVVSGAMMVGSVLTREALKTWGDTCGIQIVCFRFRCLNRVRQCVREEETDAPWQL